MSSVSVDQWLYPTDRGLYCAPASVYIDPARPVGRAIITDIAIMPGPGTGLCWERQRPSRS